VAQRNEKGIDAATKKQLEIMAEQSLDRAEELKQSKVLASLNELDKLLPKSEPAKGQKDQNKPSTANKPNVQTSRSVTSVGSSKYP